MVSDKVVVTGIGLELPGVSLNRGLLHQFNEQIDLMEFDFVPKLGKKGYKYKDHATRIALCAAKSALEDAEIPTEKKALSSPERFGIVASSNLCNLDTVGKTFSEIEASGISVISPMNLPNASSNEVASGVAIWFGAKAFSLMICNGTTSGIDALYNAKNLIRTGRADIVCVVGVEPKNDIVSDLMTRSFKHWLENDTAPKLAEGGAALIVESYQSAMSRNVRMYCAVEDYLYSGPNQPLANSFIPLLTKNNNAYFSDFDLWMCPNRSYKPIKDPIDSVLRDIQNDNLAVVDIGRSVGELYGSLGVIQSAIASFCIGITQKKLAIATSGGTFNEGSASIVLTSV